MVFFLLLCDLVKKYICIVHIMLKIHMQEILCLKNTYVLFLAEKNTYAMLCLSIPKIYLKFLV